jgi:DNA-binding transcriptional ArsR family regulator
MNMINPNPSTLIADLFKSLSQPARVEILLAIGAGEACVCHLEAILKMRQAYLSQHLMALRQAGILEARRDGRFIYYSLADPQMMDLIHLAAQASGAQASGAGVVFAAHQAPHPSCPCPHCAPANADDLLQLDLPEPGNPATA